MRGVLRDDRPAGDDQRHPPPRRLRRDDDQHRDDHDRHESNCFIAADCISRVQPSPHHQPSAISHPQPCPLYSPPCRFTSSTIRSCTTRSSRCATRPRTPEHFRRAATRISVLLTAEALRDLPPQTVTVETPLGPGAGTARRLGRRRRAGAARRARDARRRARARAERARRPHRPAARRDDRGRVAVLFEAAVAARLELRADDRSDARDRRQRGRRARPAAAGRRQRHPHDLHRRRAGRRRAGRAASSRTSRSTRRSSTTSSTRRNTSCPASATSAIGCTARSSGS